MEVTSIIDKNPFFSMWIVYIAGVATSFTPCIYPLIPVTVGVIGAQTGKKIKSFTLSLLYVTGMAVTYTVLGVAAAIGGRVFGLTAYNPWVNFIVGLVFLVFGLSMFGVINLPMLNALSSFAAKHGGGVRRIFFIGLISGLVAAPCATPVLGSILAFVTVSKNIFMGGMLLFIYGFGCGTLLIVVGTFAGLTSSLPKSGKWMVTVKYVFGGIIILGAFYFFYRAIMSL